MVADTTTRRAPGRALREIVEVSSRESTESVGGSTGEIVEVSSRESTENIENIENIEEHRGHEESLTRMVRAPMRAPMRVLWLCWRV